MTGKKTSVIVVVISFVAILIRSVLQLLIPSSDQTVLQQSEFVMNGTLPIAFMIYGTLAFIAITLIFRLIHTGMGGSSHSKGLKTGLIYSVVWTVFLVEPLPHGSAIDLFTYPLADSMVLIILGLMTGRFISHNSPEKKHHLSIQSISNVAIITLFFMVGRIIEYRVFHIYSMFEQAQVKTLIWVICAGIIIGLMYDFLNHTILTENAVKKSFIFGGIMFGINLLFFNFFLPLVLKVDIVDMGIRTFIDSASVILGCLIINIRRRTTLG
jgi:hypothetical protein